MTDEPTIKLVRSDREQVIDLVSSLVGLAILYYTLNPEPFDTALDKIRAWGRRVLYRWSVYEALTEIRSLPETDS